jgi:hypothetical protein
MVIRQHHNATGNKSAKKKNVKKRVTDARKLRETELKRPPPHLKRKKMEPRLGYGVNLGALQFAGKHFPIRTISECCL